VKEKKFNNKNIRTSKLVTIQSNIINLLNIIFQIIKEIVCQSTLITTDTLKTEELNNKLKIKLQQIGT